MARFVMYAENERSAFVKNTGEILYGKFDMMKMDYVWDALKRDFRYHTSLCSFLGRCRSCTPPDPDRKTRPRRTTKSRRHPELWSSH
jgi:hypothetical protein